MYALNIWTTHNKRYWQILPDLVILFPTPNDQLFKGHEKVYEAPEGAIPFINLVSWDVKDANIAN